MVEGKEKVAPAKQSVMFLLYKDGKFLLERRLNPEKSYHGHVIVPGGKVRAEEGETVLEALYREVAEEHGVDAIDSAWLDTFEDVSPRGNHYLVHAYLVLDYRGDAKENEPEKAELVWLSHEEALKELKFANSRYVLNLAQKYLNEEVQSKD